jgi:hypothetical protein
MANSASNILLVRASNRGPTCQWGRKVSVTRGWGKKQNNKMNPSWSSGRWETRVYKSHSLAISTCKDHVACHLIIPADFWGLFIRASGELIETMLICYAYYLLVPFVQNSVAFICMSLAVSESPSFDQKIKTCKQSSKLIITMYLFDTLVITRATE